MLMGRAGNLNQTVLCYHSGMSAILHVKLPAFIAEINDSGIVLSTLEARMEFVIDLARRNIAGGGGPFGAAVFERDSGRLVAAGVNRVIASRCSSAHAEIMALSLAQQRVGGFDLGAVSQPAHQLVSSSEPCVMCFGAAIWSGVRHLVCGARDEDARAVGFDEGPKPSAWAEELRQRGIQVTLDVLRSQAVAVLKDYTAGGGLVYNARC
ncbi:tRNA(Arg) A34 adenosine deaminase TadA [Denitratisoma oestradiolicum]|uniref:tRNA(Arg) A34 adenosine deaminase TadA n=2 Tax=Denitratisoma oestradiolicum TaxID=311182 RepID=A0A6S6Y5K0_9PROT|nr:tRNA(Arg) A34 adenosine deaminase TadA [Denitratisoma oestradiolicum]